MDSSGKACSSSCANGSRRFLHVTPSFWLQHVVYVDRHGRAGRFFADEEGVRRFVNARRHYRPPAYLRFLSADYTRPLPLPEASFDLLLALYAPGVSRLRAVPQAWRLAADQRPLRRRSGRSEGRAVDPGGRDRGAAGSVRPASRRSGWVPRPETRGGDEGTPDRRAAGLCPLGQRVPVPSPLAHARPCSPPSHVHSTGWPASGMRSWG